MIVSAWFFFETDALFEKQTYIATFRLEFFDGLFPELAEMFVSAFGIDYTPSTVRILVG